MTLGHSDSIQCRTGQDKTGQASTGQARLAQDWTGQREDREGGREV